MSTWQPIETAPKDGTWVMMWQDDHWLARWCESLHAWETMENELLLPTHWQPLPEPPEVTK